MSQLTFHSSNKWIVRTFSACRTKQNMSRLVLSKPVGWLHLNFPLEIIHVWQLYHSSLSSSLALLSLSLSFIFSLSSLSFPRASLPLTSPLPHIRFLFPHLQPSISLSVILLFLILALTLVFNTHLPYPILLPYLPYPSSFHSSSNATTYQIAPHSQESISSAYKSCSDRCKPTFIQIVRQYSYLYQNSIWNIHILFMTIFNWWILRNR